MAFTDVELTTMAITLARENAATGARRQGKHLRREAKLQARLAAKSIGQ